MLLKDTHTLLQSYKLSHLSWKLELGVVLYPLKSQMRKWGTVTQDYRIGTSAAFYKLI